MAPHTSAVGREDHSVSKEAGFKEGLGMRWGLPLLLVPPPLLEVAEKGGRVMLLLLLLLLEGVLAAI